MGVSQRPSEVTRIPDHLCGLTVFQHDSCKTKLLLRPVALWLKLCCQPIKEAEQGGERREAGYRGQTHMLFHWLYLLLHVHYEHISNSLLPHSSMQITVCWCYDSKYNTHTIKFISISAQNYWLQRWAFGHTQEQIWQNIFRTLPPSVKVFQAPYELGI